jgi:TonB family protein
MRKLFFTLGILIWMSAAHAQVGPNPSRLLSRQMPTNAPSPKTFNAVAELLITARGRVDEVTIVSSSGDPAFDKQWRKSLSEWRFLPAVNEAGEPVESLARVTYTPTSLTTRPVQADDAPVVDEAARFESMSCKNFLWEYRFVTDSMPRRLALLDPLLKTPQRMLVAQSTLGETQLRTLTAEYDRIVEDAAEHCDDNPDDLFVEQALKPAMQARLVQ